jgi:hypothetical protein
MTRETRQDMFSRYCDSGMADPLSPENWTQKSATRHGDAALQARPSIVDDSDQGDPWPDEAHGESDPEPEPNKCPECKEPMQWDDGDDDTGYPGAWFCEECNLNMTSLGEVSRWEDPEEYDN